MISPYFISKSVIARCGTEVGNFRQELLCILTNSNDEDFNTMIHSDIDLKLNEIISDYWNHKSLHTVCYYPEIWNTNHSYKDELILNLQPYIKTPTISITPYFVKDYDQTSIHIKVNFWNRGDTEEDTNIPRLSFAIPTRIKISKSIKLYTDEERNELISELLNIIICILGIQTDLHYWATSYQPPLLPSLISKGIIDCKEDIKAECVNTYVEFFRRIVLGQGKTGDSPILENLAKINLYTFPQRSISYLKSVIELTQGSNHTVSLISDTISSIYQERTDSKISSLNDINGEEFSNIDDANILYELITISKKYDFRDLTGAIVSILGNKNNCGVKSVSRIDGVDCYRTRAGFYFGDFKNYNFNGYGQFFWFSVSKYDGEWKEDMKHGQGTYTWADGSKYEGEWKEDKQDGTGSRMYDNGDMYVGGWKDGKYHGQGTYTWADGRKYEGEWKEAMKHGQGTYTWADGSKYEGGWKDGKYHGQGTYTWADGSKYEGGWKEGKQDGTGTRTYANGDKYDGEWKEAKYYGRGTYTWADGRIYNGDFYNDLFDGIGIMAWPDGKKYDGGWKNGKRNGYGIMTWPDDSRYVGEWKEDKRDGFGTMTWPLEHWGLNKREGRKIYKGEWKNGKRNGKGSCTWPDGEKFDGEWKDDYRDGTGIYTWWNGETMVTDSWWNQVRGHQS